ncbi:MAG TPA: hypothetical protein VG013_41480 [Gemmataceae bacterium]|jgi:hypothetical protein|nr:hypothetical protein [Gemmataceae bacterium]
MFIISKRLVGMIAVALACTAVAGCIHRVKDSARVLNQQGLADANAAVKEIKREYNLDVIVETFMKAPPGRRALDTESIYVFVYKEPAPVRVAVEVGSDPLVNKAFPEEARRQLRDLLQARFDQKEYDAGLRDGMHFIADTVQANLGMPFNWAAGLGLILPMLAAWLVLEAVRLVIRDRLPAGAGGVTISQDNGGGSFLPGLFATMVNDDIAKVAWNGGAGRRPALPPAPPVPETDHVSEFHQDLRGGEDAFQAHPAEEMMRHEE